MLVVLMLMMASSAMAQEAKFEVIGGLRYLLDTGAKTATLMPKTDSKYSSKRCEFLRFYLYLCHVILEFCLSSFRNTKVSENSDMAKSWVAFCCSGTYK